jgi:hypothetical protein
MKNGAKWYDNITDAKELLEKIITSSTGHLQHSA